jgi:two-component system CheB/CheR fusion protein
MHTIYIVEDDLSVREFLHEYLTGHGLSVQSFETAEAFLETKHNTPGACLLLDLTLYGRMDGMQLLAHMMAEDEFLPVIVINGNRNVSTAVEAMKSGAADYIQKPINCDGLLACIERVINDSCYSCRFAEFCAQKIEMRQHLTTRQAEIMERVLRGDPSKIIAYDLGISQRTVESHRAKIMKRTGSESVTSLARISLATRWRGTGRRPACFTSLSDDQTPAMNGAHATPAEAWRPTHTN